MNPKTKNIIIGIIILAVIIAGYGLLSGGRSLPTAGLSATSPAGTSTSAPASSSIGGQFVSTLLNLRTLRLDGSFFENSSFKSLKDFTITLVQPGNEGRPNPFAPLGSSAAASAASSGASSAFGLPSSGQ